MTTGDPHLDAVSYFMQSLAGTSWIAIDPRTAAEAVEQLVPVKLATFGEVLYGERITPGGNPCNH